MPLQKEFCFVGSLLRNNYQAAFVILIGIFGTCSIIYGFSQAPAPIYYVIGSSLLLITALYFKMTYFIALELILLAGHGAVLLGIGPRLQLFLPTLLSLQLFIYYLLSGRLKSMFRCIGIAGIALISIGLSYTNLWVFFWGSLFVGFFSFYSVYQGRLVALIWGILNVFLAFETGLLILTS